MRRLLVPVDGSKKALRALKYAAAQSRHGAVVLHVINVGPPLDDYGMVRAHVTPQQHQKAMKTRAAQVLGRATRGLRGTRVRCVTHSVIGDAATAIVAAASRLRCESIVMGTRGMGALGNLILGSVANKVIHRATVPVTLVK